jgi:FkbM family methyltransferase
VVYAFEANPEVFGLHAASPDLAGIANRHIAICDTVGPMTVYAPRTLMQYFDGTQVVAGRVEEPRITGKTSLRLRNEDASYAQFEVFGTTLDAFISEESILASETTLALWIDAEGAADKVLAGAGAVLAQTVAIFVEVESFEFWKGQSDSTSITPRTDPQGFCSHCTRPRIWRPPIQYLVRKG